MLMLVIIKILINIHFSKLLQIVFDDKNCLSSIPNARFFVHRAFEVRCLHIPVHDRTPFEGLKIFLL